MSESLITKKAISNSIKEIMKNKPLQKISVAEIVKKCGINRQTFYYHFKDKYDLVDWIYYNEVVSSIIQDKTFYQWSSVVLEVLKTMKREQYFYTNALSVTGQNAFQEYFFAVTKDLLSEFIDQLFENNKIEKEDKNFIAEFYAHGLVGVVVQWARKGMNEEPEKIVQRLSNFINDINYYAAKKYFIEHGIDKDKIINKL